MHTQKIVLVLTLLVIGMSAWFFGFRVDPTFVQVDPHTQVVETLPSRTVMEYAQEVVRFKKPSPPESARFYAYVASVYVDVLKETENAGAAQHAAALMVNHLYPDMSASSSAWIATQAAIDPRHPTGLREEGKLDAGDILNVYTSRADHDKDGSSTPARPTGDAYWLGESPLEVTAGSWDRWIVSDMSFPIPPPPEYMSAEHTEGLNAVYEAALARSSEQGAMVNFWGGVPGTEAPAGIWQNRLYNVTKDSGLTDVEYAEAQKILAQALADSFMECWKSKYTYWTKRPSMIRGDIQLAMDNPRFPSYVSGHSTISRTAAEVLAALFPEYSDTWYKDAEEAKNSRLWAGIHYPYDNENGAALGYEIGVAIVTKLQLKPIQ